MPHDSVVLTRLDDVNHTYKIVYKLVKGASQKYMTGTRDGGGGYHILGRASFFDDD